MGRAKLQAAIQKNGGARSYVNSEKYETMSDEQVKLAAFESRRNQDIDITLKMANDHRRNTLLSKAGFDWFDVESLQPHPDNAYSIDEESIKNLAGLIYKSKEIQPLVVRETRDGIQILDGERRWRACKLLVEMYGDEWRMVPAHCHRLDTITDEQALFILHSNNMGQRIMTPSERAMGFEVLAEALVEWRKNDPALKGKKTKTYLAEHFGVSERTAMTNLAIARGLTPEGKSLLDSGMLTIEQAEHVSRLPEESQKLITETISQGTLSSDDRMDLIQAVRAGEKPGWSDTSAQASKMERKKKETDGYLKTARNALKKASRCPEAANLALIGEIKQLLKEIEQIHEY